MKLWEALVTNLPPKNILGMPDNPRKWIFEYHTKERGERSIFRKLVRVTFEEDKGREDGARDSHGGLGHGGSNQY